MSESELQKACDAINNDAAFQPYKAFGLTFSVTDAADDAACVPLLTVNGTALDLDTLQALIDRYRGFFHQSTSSVVVSFVRNGAEIERVRL